MDCPKCKAQVEIGAVYCNKCGFVFDSDENSGQAKNDDGKLELKKKLLLLFGPSFCSYYMSAFCRKRGMKMKRNRGFLIFLFIVGVILSIVMSIFGENPKSSSYLKIESYAVADYLYEWVEENVSADEMTEEPTEGDTTDNEQVKYFFRIVLKDI